MNSAGDGLAPVLEEVLFVTEESTPIARLYF